MGILNPYPDKCSAFGRLVLEYLKENPQTNMSQLARQVGISHAGITWICLRKSNPSEDTAKKIAQIIGVDETKVARLVHENKLERLASLGKLNYITKVGDRLVTRKISAEDAIAGLNAIFYAFQYVIRSVPETEKPSDFQAYRQAYEIIKKQFLKNTVVSRE